MRLRTQGLTWREIDGEAVVLDLKSSTYLTANGTGTFLLRELVEDRTGAHLVDAVVAEFGVDADVATNDVNAFLTVLERHGLLEDADTDLRVRAP